MRRPLELATERAYFPRFARSVSVVSQNATLPVAFSANVVFRLVILDMTIARKGTLAIADG